MHRIEDGRGINSGHGISSTKDPKTEADATSAVRVGAGSGREGAARNGGRAPATTKTRATASSRARPKARTTSRSKDRVEVQASAGSSTAPGPQGRPGPSVPTGDVPAAPAGGSGPETGRAHDAIAPRRSKLGLGRYGEEVAARRLAHDGLRILERNWRCSDGEIDIVALDGETLAVCEVKTRSERAFQQPAEGIDRTKAERLRRLAERWLSERWPVHFERLARCVTEAMPGTGRPDVPAPAPPGGVRIDLIAVVNRFKGAALVEHVRGAV